MRSSFENHTCHFQFSITKFHLHELTRLHVPTSTRHDSIDTLYTQHIQWMQNATLIIEEIIHNTSKDDN